MLRTRIAVTAAASTVLAAAVPALADGQPLHRERDLRRRLRRHRPARDHGPKGGVLGTAYLLYDRRSKRNCAVMIKRRATATPTFAEVSLRRAAGTWPTAASSATTPARCTCTRRAAA